MISKVGLRTIKKYLNRLSLYHGMLDTPPELAECIRETHERLTRHYYSTLGEKRLATWVLRSAIIAWRKAMILKITQKEKYTEDITDFVSATMELDMQAKHILWGEELKLDKPEELLIAPTGGRMLLLNALPDKFTAEEANTIRVKSGAKDNMGLTRNLLSKWKSLGYIKETEGGYQKLKG